MEEQRETKTNLPPELARRLTPEFEQEMREKERWRQMVIESAERRLARVKRLRASLRR